MKTHAAGRVALSTHRILVLLHYRHQFDSVTASEHTQMPFMARYDPFSPTPVHPLLNSSPDFGARNGTYRTRPIGDVVPQLSFRERNKRLKEYDDNKDQLIEVGIISPEDGIVTDQAVGVIVQPRVCREPAKQAHT